MNGPELASELGAEMEDLRETLSRLEEVRSHTSQRQPTHVELTAMAAYLANLYAGLERMLLRIVKHAGYVVPDGPSWHRGLLERFRSRSGEGLPGLLDDALCNELAPFLGFRHLFVHSYAVRLDWELMRDAVEAAQPLFTRVVARLEEYRASLLMDPA